MNKKTIILLIFTAILVIAPGLKAEQSLTKKLSGYILLQVEGKGEAWYVNPGDFKRYYMGRPDDAFNIMQDLSIGTANENLNKIPIGVLNYKDLDEDNDGLANRLEQAIGTDPASGDTDKDGFNDKMEIENNYSPVSFEKLPIDKVFTDNQLGKIFLQVENHGEAWYVNPDDKKRYYLGRPSDAFEIMQKFGLGITTTDLSNIVIGTIPSPPLVLFPNPTPEPSSTTPDQIFFAAAAAIRTGNNEEALSYFIPEMEKAVEYTLNFLDQEGRFTLGNIMAGSKQTESTETKKTYSTEVYFSLGGYSVPVDFYVEKQEDGSWLLANL